MSSDRRLLWKPVVFSAALAAASLLASSPTPAYSQPPDSVTPDPVRISRYYSVVIQTGNQFGAGTDANVSITLYGELDEVKKTLSDEGILTTIVNPPPGMNVFERGMTDAFIVQTEKDLGPIHAIKLEHDNKGGGPGWYCVWASVAPMDTARKNTTGPEQKFVVDRWFAYDEPPKTLSGVFGEDWVEPTQVSATKGNAQSLGVREVQPLLAGETVVLTSVVTNNQSLEVGSQVENSDLTKVAVAVEGKASGTFLGVGAELKTSASYGREIGTKLTKSAKKAAGETETKSKVLTFMGSANKVKYVVSEEWATPIEGTFDLGPKKGNKYRLWVWPHPQFFSEEAELNSPEHQALKKKYAAFLSTGDK